PTAFPYTTLFRARAGQAPDRGGGVQRSHFGPGSRERLGVRRPQPGPRFATRDPHSGCPIPGIHGRPGPAEPLLGESFRARVLVRRGPPERGDAYADRQEGRSGDQCPIRLDDPGRALRANRRFVVCTFLLPALSGGGGVSAAAAG